MGPENGKGARPSDLKWYLRLYDQAEAAGADIFIKGLPTDQGNVKGIVLPQEFPEGESE
jgi:hypothetical protein